MLATVYSSVPPSSNKQRSSDFSLVFPFVSMAIDNVDRVTVKSDEDWKNGFIPWLENHERNHVGVEDGVFVVSDRVS